VRSEDDEDGVLSDTKLRLLVLMGQLGTIHLRTVLFSYAIRGISYNDRKKP
jgi:hypothetical protein